MEGSCFRLLIHHFSCMYTHTLPTFTFLYLLHIGAGSSNSSSSKGDEARQQREERRLQRQREIEAKRAARSGAMKLGAKRI